MQKEKKKKAVVSAQGLVNLTTVVSRSSKVTIQVELV